MPRPRFNIDNRGFPVIQAHYRNYNILYLPDICHFIVNSATLDHEGRQIIEPNINYHGDGSGNGDSGGRADGCYEGCFCTACVSGGIMLGNWFRDWVREIKRTGSRTDYCVTVVFVLCVAFDVVISAILAWYFIPMIVDIATIPLLTVVFFIPLCVVYGAAYYLFNISLTLGVVFFILETAGVRLYSYASGREVDELYAVWATIKGRIGRNAMSVGGVIAARLLRCVYKPADFVFRRVLYPAFRGPAVDVEAMNQNHSLLWYEAHGTAGRLDPMDELSPSGTSDASELEMRRLGKRIAMGSAVYGQGGPSTLVSAQHGTGKAIPSTTKQD